MKKKIAILTSGGDSPGMNSVIRSVCKIAIKKDYEVYGITRGYLGMLNDDIFHMSEQYASGIIDKGGTKLLTARCEEFKEAKFREIAANNLKKRDIDKLVVIGGDGSYRGADLLNKEHGINVIGIPGTIDNDITGTDFTIGFDTSLNTILGAISKIRDMAISHERTVLIEVMGRHSGNLALQACLAGGGDGVLIPEIENPLEMLSLHLAERRKKGKLHDIVLVAEGVGNVFEIEKELTDKLSSEVRSVVLGYVQRGGSPSGFDRILATKMGMKAVELLGEGNLSVMIGLENNKLVTHPLDYAWTGTPTRSVKDDYELAMLLAK